MAKFTATIEIEIPEPDAGMISKEHWTDQFRELYALWHPFDLSVIQSAVAECLTDEHHGICEYEGARCADGKIVP